MLSYMPGHTQTLTADFLPELDARVGLSSNVRLVFQNKQTLDDRLARTELGPSIDFYLKPIRILGNVTLFDLDETKPVPLTLSVGYRALIYPEKPTTSRVESVVLVHLPFWGRILATDQNRADMDWSDGGFYWRYRNRLTTERGFTIHSYHPRPYASAEFFYTSRYAKWSNSRLYAGCILPLGRHFELDPYYEHDNDTGPQPNQQINAAGFILSLYFSKHKK